METCEKCKIKFPDEFYSPFIHMGGQSCLCPECVLEKRNEIHGLPKGTPFRGQVAQQMLDDFKEWKKKQKS